MADQNVIVANQGRIFLAGPPLVCSQYTLLYHLFTGSFIVGPRSHWGGGG